MNKSDLFCLDGASYPCPFYGNSRHDGLENVFAKNLGGGASLYESQDHQFIKFITLKRLIP